MATGGGSVSDRDSRRARDGHVGREGPHGEEGAGGLEGTRGEEGAGRMEPMCGEEGAGGLQGRDQEETQNSKRHCLSSTHCVPDHMHHMCYLTFLQLH